MKTLLINPYVPQEVIYGNSSGNVGATLPPLGIFYLTSYLRELGKPEADLLDACALTMDAEAVRDYVRDGGYEVVGFSATTLAYPYASEAARLIREALPQTKLVLGGAHAQGAAQKVLEEERLFDYVCYGEGEFAFVSLLDYLRGELSKDQLVGFAYIEDDQIVQAPAAEIPDNLDVFGHPITVVPKELIPLYHEKKFAYKELPMFSVMTSRGCPFKCTFCSTPRKYQELYEGKARFHSVEWVLEELRLLETLFGVREIIFVDDTFNLRKKRVKEFCQGKIDAGIQIIWSCNFEANIVDHEMMSMMSEAGCWAIMIGGESGSNRMLDFIKKGVTKEQLQKAANIASDLGICTRVSFILGMPSDTEESIQETIDFVKQTSFHFPYFQLYVPLPGTDMYDQLEEYGTLRVSDAKDMSASHVNYLPEGVSEEFLLNTYKKVHKEVYLRWSFLVNHLKLIRSFGDLKRYASGFLSLMGL